MSIRLIHADSHGVSKAESWPSQPSCAFQPIVDLIAARPIGYEALARGAVGDESPASWFAEARRAGLLWELEEACRGAALARIAALSSTLAPSTLFFLNISPDVMQDPRFESAPLIAELRRLQIDATRVVLEITEHATIADHALFRSLTEEFGRRGFQFAADDFGAGHSSLVSLIACTPRFIKLDRELVRDIHQSPYRQQLVRSLIVFAASVDARVIAEGAEEWRELEALLKLGVRYAQGFVLGRPTREPEPLAPEVRKQLQQLVVHTQSDVTDADEIVDSLVLPARALDADSTKVEVAEQLFQHNPTLDHLVLVRGGRPVGLVTRDDFFARRGGRYAYALTQRKPIESVAKPAPLSVAARSLVTTLGAEAMERPATDLYDPVLVVDGEGLLVGTITMQSLIKRSVDLQIRSAQGANPLTGLPGNRQIHKWVAAYADRPSLVIVYADLDRFKEYNDRYGFLMGDELIRLCARALTQLTREYGPDARLGHVGGDDFVALFPEGLSLEPLTTVCAQFDREKLALIDPEDVERGYLVARNRRGESEQVPLVTVSLSVIQRSSIAGELHLGHLSQLAASLKRKVKEQTALTRASGFLHERRSYDVGERSA